MNRQKVGQSGLQKYERGQSAKEFSVSGRYAILIDGSSVDHALRALNADLDYRKLFELFGDRKHLVCANYYTLATPCEDNVARPLLDWLDYNGYNIREKLAPAVIDAAGRKIPKGSVSLEIAIDAFDLAPLVDHLILFSGDGNLTALVDLIQRKGVQVTAVSTQMSRPPMIANELRRQVDRFVEFRDLLPMIERKL